MNDPAKPESAIEELRYFQALEEAFIRLRGAPLLLSPSDWQVAQRWRALGVPLDFAVATLVEIFARRRERGHQDRISGLRYCARAVEAAWAKAEELAGPTRVAAAPQLDTERRLRALADTIPEGWAREERVHERILAIEGDPATVESRLTAIDDWMLERAAARISPGEAAALEAWVEARLEPLRQRFDAEEIARAAARLRARELRRRSRLPLLSLFAPEAERAD